MAEGPRIDDTWFLDFFDTHYETIFGPAISPEETERSVNALLGLVGFEPGWRILDAPGGDGRHAVPLAVLGAHVTVVDVAATMLARARRDARRAGVDVRVEEADLRRPLDLAAPPPHGPPFDLVLNLYNSFGYFAEPEEDQVLLDSLVAAVDPGGRLVMEVANRAAALAVPTHETTRVGPTTLAAHRRWDPDSQRLAIHYRLEHDSGESVTTGTVQRLYTTDDLVAMLRSRGLRIATVAGDLDGRPLDDDQDYVVVVAER